MKELYISPEVEIVKFLALEQIASDPNFGQGDTSGDDFVWDEWGN